MRSCLSLVLTLILLLSALPLRAQRERMTLLHPRSFDSFSLSVATNIRMDADGEMIACKFYADRTTAIDGIDWNVTVGGTVTDTNFTVEINADSSDAPSGTPLGAASAAFAGPAATGLTGLNTFTDTGALTLNAAYWAVLKRASGGSLSGTDYLEGRTEGTGNRFNGEKARHHDGTNWTNTTAVLAPCLIVFRHTGGTYSGTALTANQSSSAQTDIFSTNRQGIKVKYGAQVKIMGARLVATKTGSPSALEIVVYEGATEKYSDQIAAAEITSAVSFVVWFASPVLLAADTDIYVVLRQAADGGSDAADYDLRTWACNATYLNASMAPDMRMVAGTGDDPTALSVVTSECPWIQPIVVDPAAEFDTPAASGGVKGII